ncbi:MAG: PorT family protein [Sphingobacteriaceae bacterium]|nr:PorT family protein [Sphingobacteriaceae bacterium]
MKKSVLFSALSIMYLSVIAQTDRTSVDFNFKAGLHFSNMNFNKGYQKPAEPVKAAWKPGFLLGFTLNVPLYQKLSLQPEYLYLQTAGENKASGSEYSLSYISLPVLLRYPVSNNIHLIAGPQFDLLVKASGNLNNVKSTITHDTEERSISAIAAIELKINNLLSIDARYLHGLNHIGIGQRSEVTEFKFEGLQLSGVIKF